MYGKNHTADGHYQGDGAKEDRRLVVAQFLTIIISQAIHDKDAVVYSDTEDKGGDDDVDEVKSHVENHHCTEYNHPAQQNGHKAQQGMFDIEVETDKQYEEDEKHGDPLQYIKIFTHVYQCICRIIIGVKD